MSDPASSAGEVHNGCTMPEGDPDSVPSAIVLARRIAAEAIDKVVVARIGAEDVVYVMVAEQARAAKIGLTTHIGLPQRLEKIQAYCPVKLSLALKIPGNPCHKAFTKWIQGLSERERAALLEAELNQRPQ